MSPRQKEPITYEHALLGFLVESPMHAYALHVALVQSPLGAVWHLKQSACYAMIARLAEEDMVDTGSGDDARGKRVLTITPHGYACFRQWCITPVPHPRDMRIEFLAKLYFATAIAVSERQTLIAAQQQRIAYWYPKSMTTHRFHSDVLSYRRGQIDAIAAWLVQLNAHPNEL